VILAGGVFRSIGGWVEKQEGASGDDYISSAPTHGL
jgi:hypothetical protein